MLLSFKFFRLNIPQKRVGQYLSMSGVCVANSRRAYKHTFKQFFVAAILSTLSRPCYLFALAILCLASLHTSVNHGARVFPHLFGFFGDVIVISLTTPALTASYSKKLSTFSARSALLMETSSTRVVSLWINSDYPVCSVHFYADVAQLWTVEPSIHL